MRACAICSAPLTPILLAPKINVNERKMRRSKVVIEILCIRACPIKSAPESPILLRPINLFQYMYGDLNL